MKILFVGGKGNISWRCVQEALSFGYEVWELNRNETIKTRRQIQSQVHQLICDIHNKNEVLRALQGLAFDCVCDFICYNDADARDALSIFTGMTRHFIFISSEAVYKRQTVSLPFKETSEQYDPDSVCPYIAGKIKAEQVFMDAYEKNGFPVTIVRPCYTYDTIVPTPLGQNCFTAIKRMIDGDAALVCGDGINICTFTHSSDFAAAFRVIIADTNSIGQDYHIASDEWLTWNDELKIILTALNIDRKTIHIPYKDVISLPFFEADIMKQKMWHNIYDNSKIKGLAKGWSAKKSFSQGIRETLSWLFEDPQRQRINQKFNAVFDSLYAKYNDRSLV